MDNFTINKCAENRRIVQDGLDRRAEVRAMNEAKMDAYERNMITLCNESTARNRERFSEQKAMEAYTAMKATEKILYAFMENPKSMAKRRKMTDRHRIKESFFAFTSFGTFLLILRTAEDFGAAVAVTIPLAVFAAVVTIVRIAALNRSAFRRTWKRRASR